MRFDLPSYPPERRNRVHFACDAIKKGLLKPVLCEFEPKPMSLYAIYPSPRHLPRRVRTLIDLLAECFSENPYWDIFTLPSPPG